MRHRHPVNQEMLDGRKPIDVKIDTFVSFFGSLRYLEYQTAFIIVWIALNSLVVALRWDPYPWILLNLIFSTQASYAAPLILLSQNRQSERDRLQAEHDFQVNEDALAEIREIKELLQSR